MPDRLDESSFVVPVAIVAGLDSIKQDMKVYLLRSRHSQGAYWCFDIVTCKAEVAEGTVASLEMRAYGLLQTFLQHRVALLPFGVLGSVA